MKVFFWILFLVHATSAFKPPTIDVEDYQVQEHGSIGRFIELKENDNLIMKCGGRFDDLKFNFPNMEEHVGYSQQNFQNRVEEYIDDNFGETVLSIRNVQESDTGTYSCTSLEHSSLNDTLHVFVSGSNTFIPLKSIGFMYDEGEVMVPCKATKFLEKNDIELYANEALVKSASKNYDPRYGFKLTKKIYDVKPIQNVPFECRYKKDLSQTPDYLITEKEPNSSDDDFKFYWEKEMDWPFVGYNYTLICHLVYNGSAGNFHPYYNTLHAECPQCSSVKGSHAFADRHRLNGNQISVTVRVESLELEDSGAYRCIWKKEGNEDRVIEEHVHVAPKKAQIKVVERSPQIVRMKQGRPFSLSALFAMYPTEGEGFQAKWSRMYNSSIKENLQSETIINDEYRTVSTNKIRDGTFSEKFDISPTAVTANMSGTYVLSISLLDTVQVVQWEVAIENEVPDVQLAIREPSSFIVFNQQFYPTNTHLHIDCISVSIPPGEVIFEKKTKHDPDYVSIDPSLLDRVGGTFESGFIWNMTLDDNVDIRCSSTKNGKTVTAKKSIIVADKAPFAYSKIIKSQQSTATEDSKTLYEGDSVELTCVVPTGVDDWTVFWRYDNIVYDSESEIQGHSKHVVLKLNDVTSESSGRYTCVVKNGDDEKHLDKDVTIERISKPHHTNADSRATVVVDYNELFKLDCNMVGSPPPDFKWYKNGHEYTHGDVVEGSLTVTRARAEDDGEFQCVAKNRAGSTSNIIEVQVKGAPKGSSLAYWITAFIFIIAVVIVMILAYKLRVSKKIAKQKDIQLCELYDHMKNEGGPLPENMKGLPINEKIYYLTYNKDYEVLRENLEIDRKIGEGNFGVVCKGLLQMADPKSEIEYKTRLPVAIKTANNRYNIQQQQMLSDELKVMCAIGKHPNVLALVGACTSEMRKGQFFLITEYMEGGDLLDFLKKHRESFIDELEDVDEEGPVDNDYLTPNSAKKNRKYKENGKHGEHGLLLGVEDATICTSDLMSFSMQIANGMEYLASVPCVHRDLACRNVLLTRNKIVRIADFGLAKRHPNKSYYVTKNSKETPIPARWMAPESIIDFRYTHKSDVWSYGICLYEIFTLGGLPYPGIESTRIVEHLQNGLRNSQPKYCHDNIFDLMKKCWSAKEQDRPTFTECLDTVASHMRMMSHELLEHVDKLLVQESEHQEKLDDWVARSRPAIPGRSFTKPAKKPVDERYFIVESHA